MVKDFQEIAKILSFDNSFFEKVERFGGLGFYEIDLIGGKMKVSTNFKRLFNLPEKSCYSPEVFLEFIHPDDISWVIEGFYACMEERRDFEFVYRVIVKGDVRYIRGQSVFISNESGEPVKVVGMEQDVTNEKLAEIERQKYVKDLEHAHEMTTTVVHDLKAPIHNISMVAELLKGSVAEGMEGLIEVVQGSCHRSYDIIKDVLERSLTDGGVSEKNKVWYDIHMPINNAVSTLYYTAQKKNIKILTNLQPKLYAFVHPQKLQRAIENLFSNAIKFSHRNSQIEVSLFGKDKALVIKVEDFGLGMNETQSSMLFNKENGLGRNGTDGEKSSGFGLGIVKKIIDEHNGKIWLESEEGRGSTFYIELPKE